MNKSLIGAHVSFSCSKGIRKTLEEQPDIYDCFQVYISSPQSFSSPCFEKEELFSVRNKRLFVHASLVYNLCGSKEGELCPKYQRNLAFTRKGLARDLDICAMMGCGLVVHIGAAKEREWGMKKVAETVDVVLSENSDLTESYSEFLGKDIRKERLLLLENCAGEGTKLGRDIPELAKIYSLIQNKTQTKFCIDTCHGFASGTMDFSSFSGIDEFWKEWEETLGKDKIELFHLNDSKGEFGSKKDRHETLLCGKIWEEKHLELAYFLDSARRRNIPMILERKEDTMEKEALLCKKLLGF